MGYKIYYTNKKITLPKRGYFTKGDNGEEISIISTFLAGNFMGYEYKTKIKIDDMLGDYYGNNLIVWVKQFQSNNNLEVDGNIGPKTLKKLEEYGLNS